MSSIDVNRNRMLALISTILAAAALRASYPVTMPLAAAMLLIAAIWPVKLGLIVPYPGPAISARA